MPRGTASWLIDHTALTFEQIAVFCSMHVLEVQSLADGATFAPSNNPIMRRQITQEEITRCEQDASAQLQLIDNDVQPVTTKKAKQSRYTPISLRVNRPHAIAWCLRNHPELTDAQIRHLVGTTAKTINMIREKLHPQMGDLNPRPPSDLGLCTEAQMQETIAAARQREADEEVRRLRVLEEAAAAAAPPPTPPTPPPSAAPSPAPSPAPEEDESTSFSAPSAAPEEGESTSFSVPTS